MEAKPGYVIPTSWKPKISHHLSWPVGAELVSLALSETVQLPKLTLRFREDLRQQVRTGQYVVLQVSYARRPLTVHALPNAGIPMFDITVGPVPRILRQRIRLYILESALPLIRGWLDQRHDLVQEGTDRLTFVYNERKEEFHSESETHLQPVRRSGRNNSE